MVVLIYIFFIRGKDHIYFQERGKSHSVKSNAEVGASVNRNLHEKNDKPDAHIPSESVDLLSGRVQKQDISFITIFCIWMKSQQSAFLI